MLSRLPTRALTWALAVASAGCTSSQPQRTPSTVVQPVPNAEPSTEAPTAKSRVWGMLDRDAKLFGYIDTQRLVASPLFDTLLSNLRAVRLGRDPIEDFKAQCGFDPFKTVREIIFAGNPDQKDLLIVVAHDVSSTQALGCLQKFDPKTQPVTVAGRAGIGDKAYAAVPEGRLLVIGTHAKVEALLEAMPVPSGSPPVDDYVVVTGSVPNGLGLRQTTFSIGTVPGKTGAAAKEGTRLRLDLRTSSAEEAKALETKAREALNRLPMEPSEAARFRAAYESVIKGINFARDDDKLSVAIVLEDAHAVGTLLSLSVYGVKRYLTAAKADEARKTLGDLSHRLVLYAKARRPHRFPPSAPPVPATVPADSKHVSSAADWQHPGWTAISYARSDPQYYSYEFVTSKDGKRVTVRARGDLDGDGVLSLFEIDGVINARGEPVLDPAIREVSPTE